MEKMLRRLIGENVLLETHRDPDLWPVLADPSQLEQVIANLAVNARDAMPDGGLLSFETKNLTVEEDPVPGAEGLSAGRYIVLTVTDSGTGMDPDTLSQIFEPFYTTKERGKGTGLGLSTVYGIVRQTGGQIRVESVVGTGTTFEVCLPATQHTPETTTARSEAAASGGGDETILLVEDEPGVRELTEELLAEAGYTVLSAEDGVEAMRVAHQHEGVIHLLLTDVVMPDLGGAGLAEAMSVLEPGTKVLYMTGHSRETMRQDGQLEPGTHLLTKPFTQESLLGKVREVLDSGAAD